MSLLLYFHAAGCAAELHLGPYLQNVAPDGVTVMWETTEATKGAVEYGTAGNLTQRVEEAEARKIHEVRLTGLQPGTAYAYRATWEGGSTEVYSFRTAPPPGATRWRLAAYGDSRSDPAKHRAVVERLLEAQPDLVINTGDLVPDGTVLEAWKPQFFEPLAPLARSVPVFTCLGNHERNSPNYYNYVSLPGNEAWYSFDYGHAHFVCLDTQQPYGPGSEQYQWLEQDLQKAQAEWTIAFFHAPMFSAHPTRAINGNRWAWEALFERYGVDLVLTGHDHHYQRTYPIGSATARPTPGTVHFTVGGGGASLYPVFAYPYAAVVNSVHHCAIFDFDGPVVHGRAVDADGQEIDSFVIDRNQPVSPENFVAWEPLAWEKALNDAIQRLVPVPVRGPRIALQRTLRLPNPLPARVEGEIEWAAAPPPTPPSQGGEVRSPVSSPPLTKGGPGGVEEGGRWQIKPPKTTFSLAPGQELELPFEAAADWPACYPLPGATLRITGGDFATDFRNRELTIRPLRLRPVREVTVAQASEPMTVDGKLEEACWPAAPVETTFVRDSGEALPAQQTSFRVAASGTHFYLAAEVQTADAALVTSGQAERDHSQILTRDESLLLSAFVEGVQYDFAVNSRGTQYDARSGDAAWNSTWQAAVTPTGNGWSVEIALPYMIFDSVGGMSPPPGYTTAFNVARMDAARRERSEWSPTFGDWRNEERLGTVAFP